MKPQGSDEHLELLRFFLLMWFLSVKYKLHEVAQAQPPYVPFVHAGVSGSVKPREIDKEPCGSESISRTRFPSWARPTPRLAQVVVFPTPPFWLAMAMTLHFSLIWAYTS